MAGPYEGNHLYHCDRSLYPWDATSAIVVSGASWNPCGHALLRVGQHYFHTAGVRKRPFHMPSSQYQRYLEENDKRELRRMPIHIRDPHGAQRKLEQITSKPWLWGGLPNNCARFVEAVVQAGGSTAGLYSNCPRLESF